jgi:hypothetical protein
MATVARSPRLAPWLWISPFGLERMAPVGIDAPPVLYGHALGAVRGTARLPHFRCRVFIATSPLTQAARPQMLIVFDLFVIVTMFTLWGATALAL